MRRPDHVTTGGDPSRLFAQAASAAVSQTKDDGTDTIPPTEIPHRVGFAHQLVEAQEIMTVGSRGPALQDSSGKRQDWIFLATATT